MPVSAGGWGWGEVLSAGVTHPLRRSSRQQCTSGLWVRPFKTSQEAVASSREGQDAASCDFRKARMGVVAQPMWMHPFQLRVQTTGADGVSLGLWA